MADEVYETEAVRPAPFEWGTEEMRDAQEPEVRSLLYGAYYSAKDANGVTVVSFSFPDSSSSFPGYSTGSEAFIGVTAFTAEQKEGVRELMQSIEAVANIKLVEVPDTGDLAGTIRIAWTKGPNPYGSVTSTGWSYFPETGIQAGDVWLQSDTLNASSAVFSAKHEIGHGLGLKHPFDALSHNATTLPTALDSWDNTVMSYTSTRAFAGVTSVDLGPQTFMWLDIQALQAIYGTNDSHAQGDTVYDFNSGRHYLTLWDTGGTDTVDVSASSANLSLKLMPDSWLNVGTIVTYSNNGQVIGTKTDTVYVPPVVHLENAKAGSGHDVVMGNDAANVLVGGDGNDTLEGGNGNDSLWAGSGDTGDDVMQGGDGDDVLGLGAGDDLGAGGLGRDSLFGGPGSDVLLAGAWNDQNKDGVYAAGEAVTDTTDAEIIWAGSGDDTVIGAAGADMLGGGSGDDLIKAGAGDDIIYGGKDAGDAGLNDALDGGEGRDVIYGGGGADSILGGAGNDLLFNGPGNDVVAGGSGDDTLWGGGGDDTLTGGEGADVFAFTETSGSDTVTDFSTGSDVLDLSSASFSSIDAVKESAAVSATDIMLVFGETNILIKDISLDDLTENTVMI